MAKQYVFRGRFPNLTQNARKLMDKDAHVHPLSLLNKTDLEVVCEWHWATCLKAFEEEDDGHVALTDVRFRAASDRRQGVR